jgi:tripartite-type tricarboxylate transporter receptor subunit TctC
MLVKNAIAITTCIIASTAAVAQGYPEKPIHLIVPYAAGSAPDVTARVFINNVKLPVPIVVDNKPGAGGNIGAGDAARAKPDGYTLLYSGSGTHGANSALYLKMPFDPVKDFKPIVKLYDSSLVLVVPADSPASSLADIIAMAKKEPGKFKMGIPHTTARISLELLRQAAQIDIVPVPYQSNAYTGLLRGDVQMLVDTVSALLPRITSGEVKAIAVPVKPRVVVLPDVPTYAESGIDINLNSWQALFGPTGIPNEAVNTLNAAFNKALKQPELIDFLEKNGLSGAGGTPEELGRLVGTELVRWTDMVKRAGIQPE